MVTIEQKLTLFSKLLNQEIKEEVDHRLEALEAEYEKRIAENKFAVDKEANEIIEQARRSGEIKKVELLSRGKMASKKSMLLIKEKLMMRFMEALEEKIKQFITSDNYKAYLNEVIEQLNSLNKCENPLVIYLTKYDMTHNQMFIRGALIKQGLKDTQIHFEEADSSILGGLIIEDPLLSTRIDESIRAVIEEEEGQIIERISQIIGEAGEGRE